MPQNRALLITIVIAVSIPALSMVASAQVATPQGTPKQVAPPQETRPQVISKTHHQMSGGVIDGPLELTESLHVDGPLVVDGELVLGKVYPIFTKFDVTSVGNAGAELPGKRKAEVWKGSWTVGGPLVVHGSLSVPGTLYPSGGLTVGGLLACVGSPESSVFLPAGPHPIGGPIHWSCE